MPLAFMRKMVFSYSLYVPFILLLFAAARLTFGFSHVVDILLLPKTLGGKLMSSALFGRFVVDMPTS